MTTLRVKEGVKKGEEAGEGCFKVENCCGNALFRSVVGLRSIVTPL